MTTNTQERVYETATPPYEGPFPFAETHRVAWGDCDPAGIIYTPRALDYAVETVESFNREVIGASWITANWEHGFGTPTVRAEIDFLAPPAPDQQVINDLTVERLGTSSVTFFVVGHDGAGRTFFKTRLVSCYIDRKTFKAMPVPEPFRSRIHGYQAACSAQQED